MAAHNLTRAEAIEVLALINRYGGNVTAAARGSNISRETLRSRHLRAQQLLATELATVEPERPITDAIPEPKPRVRVRGNKPDGTMYRVLAIGDAHDHPDIPKDRFRWMGRHAAEMGADYVVQIGDFFTLDSLNSHIPNESLLGKLKSPWSRDMQSAKEALGEFDRGVGAHQCKRHLVGGNHERRAWFYEDSHPEVHGLMTGELLATIEDHGWTFSKYGEWFFLGSVGFIHAPLNKLGKTMSSETGQNILNKMVFDVVRGHDHQDYDKPSTKFGPIGHVTLVGLGCALPQGHIEEYAKHALNGWAWGVKELTIQGGHITDKAFITMTELERRYG